MEKHIITIYRIFALVACCILLVYAFNNKGNYTARMFKSHTQVVTEPTTENTDANGVYTAKFDSGIIVNAGGCLSFTTTFMDVRVYADDILIYENVGPGNIFMKSNGKVWHFIAVNDENKDIKIEIKPVYEDNDVIVPVYTAGNYYDIKSGIIADSIIPLIISVFDILCGVIVLFHFSRKRVQRFVNSKMVFFGTTAILIGAWSAGETDAVVVLFENRTLAGVFSFLILIFIPFPYIIYIHANLWKKDRIFYRIPLCCSLLNFMLVICLAFAGIMDFKESVIFTHSIWGISFIYVGAAVCNVIKNNKQNRDKMAIANAAAMLILVGVSGADIYLFILVMGKH